MPPGKLRPLHERAIHSIAMSARSLWSAVYSNVLPKRKSVVRAFLFSLVGLLPFLIIMLIKKPQFLVPFLLLLGYVGHLLGLTSDIMKQLRWMKRLSEQGPIFWAAARGKRALVRFSRWCYGDAMDVLPAGLSDLGTSKRTSDSATIKWHHSSTSDFSTHWYEVQIRPVTVGEEATHGGGSSSGDGSVAAADSKAEEGWIPLLQKHEHKEVCLKPLSAGISYEARVRATNSKGSSPWSVLCFTTKQSPVLLHGGAGGVGEGYRWLQSLKDETITVTLFGLPALTKARQLEVSFRPSSLTVAWLPARKGAPALLEGELHGAIVPEECLWELKDADDGEGRELHMTLQKAQKDLPLWARLLKGHPEADMSQVKREEKSLEEIMAELHKADPYGMSKVEKLKKEM